MSQKKSDGLLNILSAIFGLGSLCYLIPEMYNIYVYLLDIDMNFRWWEWISFFCGPILILFCSVMLGYKGIHTLKTSN